MRKEERRAGVGTGAVDGSLGKERNESVWGKDRVHLYYNSPEVCLSVGFRKLQVAILARSSREMSLTVRIV